LFQRWRLHGQRDRSRQAAGLELGHQLFLARRHLRAQGGQIEAHTHRIRAGLGIQTGASIVKTSRPDGTFGDDTGWGMEATGGNETRPRNVALAYIIKT